MNLSPTLFVQDVSKSLCQAPASQVSSAQECKASCCVCQTPQICDAINCRRAPVIPVMMLLLPQAVLESHSHLSRTKPCVSANTVPACLPTRDHQRDCVLRCLPTGLSTDEAQTDIKHPMSYQGGDTMPYQHMQKQSFEGKIRCIVANT